MSSNNMRSISKMLAIPRKTISNIIRIFKRTGNTKKPMSWGKEKLSLRYSAMPSYKALNVDGISRSCTCRQRRYRKLSFSFPPDIGFFLVFPVLLKIRMILEMVFSGIVNIFEILLILLPDIYSLQIAWLLSSER